jgi:hypothetical protein
MRTEAAIQRQIDGLTAMKTWLPEYSTFRNPNHLIIDAKISILDGSTNLEDINEGDWEEMDEDNLIYRGAEEALNWIYDDDIEDLFEVKS